MFGYTQRVPVSYVEPRTCTPATYKRTADGATRGFRANDEQSTEHGDHYTSSFSLASGHLERSVYPSTMMVVQC
jgi:hypothetical protein